MKHWSEGFAPARRQGMNSLAESVRSPLKGTRATGVQSSSDDLVRFSRGIRFPGGRRGRWLCIVGLATLLALLLASPPGAHAINSQALPQQLEDVGIDQKLDSQVPLDLKFRDEGGRQVELGQYFHGGKPVILTLVYYECPMLCTLVLNGLVSALRTLSFDVGEQFDIVTVSFNPDETPELAASKKETYMGEYHRAGAAAGWHFLTGDAQSIEALAQSVGFRYRYDPAIKQFAHAAAIMVLTPNGRVARYFYGVEYAPRDLRLGLIEAAENRIGTPVDQLLLYCFHYDPSSGKYSAAILNIVRLGGVLTVLALLTFVLITWERDRRSRRREARGSADTHAPHPKVTR